MKTLTLGHLLIVCALPLAFACAKKKEEKKVEPVIVAPSLLGEWEAACDSSSQFSSRSKATFNQEKLAENKTEDRVTIANLDFNGPGCQSTNASAATAVLYKYNVGAHRGSNVFDAYLEELEYTMTPMTASIADAWNRRGVCDRRDWSAGITQVVDKGRVDCVPGDMINKRPVFTVVKVEGNTLAFGTRTREADGLTPERRLTVLGVQHFKLNTLVPAPGPNPVLACPELGGVWVCRGGDQVFGGNDVIISRDANNVFLASINKDNRPLDSKVYRPSEGQRTETKSGIRFVYQDRCESSVLKTSEVVHRVSTPNDRTETTRDFSIEAGAIKIVTLETEFRDNRPARPVRVDTTCTR